MKALILDQHGSRPTPMLVERPIPVPGPGEVLVHLKAAGLNYRELYWMESGNEEAPPQIVMGGDGAGLVAALGEGVQGWSVGDRVLINPIISCGECRRCREGRPGDRHLGLG